MRALPALLFALSLLACAPQVVPLAAVSAPSQWEPDVRRFEASDRTSPPLSGGIVFVGSSSIRLWESLESDFRGLPVLNRGFGGSELSDVAQLARRIIVPYKPRLVVVYAGENDLAAGKTSTQVFNAFQSLVSTLRRDLPGARVVFVSLKPSIARLNLLDKMRETNQLIRDYTRTDDRLIYVDVFTPMLDASGQPRRELFLEDGLHMNARGYAIWRDLIAPIIR